MKNQLAPLALTIVAGLVLLTAWGNALAMFVCAILGMIAVAFCEKAWNKGDAKAGRGLLGWFHSLVEQSLSPSSLSLAR